LFLPNARGAVAQSHDRHAQLRTIPSSLLRPATVRRPGIGTAHEPVTTKAAQAQIWYDEGLAHLHSFAWLDAARAFNAALREDSGLAMAHLGLSLAFGGLGSMPGALDEVGRAQALASHTSSRDRLRIALRAQQLAALTRPDDQALAAAYTAALDKALTTNPDDVELLLLRGDAASGSASSRDSGAAAIAFYDRARRAARQAFAPHHYLAHAYENSGQFDQAIQESAQYVKIAPAVPHAHHMLGHSLLRTERAQEALEEFGKADELQSAQYKAEGTPAEYDWHSHHNVTLLAAARRYLGQLNAAGDLLRAEFDRPAPLLPEELSKRDWPALLLTRGAVDEALAAAQKLSTHSHPIVRAAGHLGVSHVQLRRGQVAAAATSADAALRELRGAGPEASVLAPDLRLTQGELFLRGGERERGRQMIREGIASLLSRQGPDDWAYALFTLEDVGRVIRDAGDDGLAAEIAAQMQQHAPSYAGTRLALGRSAERRGDRAAAAREYDAAIRQWSGADADLPGLLAARARLAGLGPTK
jgi:tetratricopeptide (TPR) repeat protein